MSHPTSWKRLASWILVFAMIFSLAVPAFAAETDGSKSLSFEKVDNDTVSVKLPVKDSNSFESLSTPEYAPTDMVRVSIVLDAPSTLEKGFSAAQVASADSGAMRYRASLENKQESMEKTISKKALDGKDLDVVWNLTLAANIISANVAYGDIEKIEALSGVKEVLIETRYEACAAASDAADPNMATSDAMIGSTAAWAAGYTGAGSKVAIIDTGADTDHPSLDAGAFEYAVKDSGAKLMTAEDITDKLSSLNAYKRYDGLTASDLYVNAKIPFGFNYVDDSLYITHDEDSQGDHGSHVTGIAAGNRYVSDGKGGYANALDTVSSQGVAPDAQVLVMKVFGKSGGAYDSDYMVAIEDAMVLGADSANLSLGSGNPGFNHISSDTYAAILQRVTESGMVVSISAGNSGSWYENSTNGVAYADGNSWATGGSPGSYTNALTVASVDNDGITDTYMEAYDHKIFYSDTSSNDYKNAPITTIAGEHEFVYVDSTGTPEDFEAVKDVLAGKIAICNRGTISFYVKAENAVAAGAIATIIANNAEGKINMDLSDYTKTQPAVSITLADANFLKEHATAVKDGSGKILYYTGKITVSGSAASETYNSDYYTMSSFSSWGVPGSLTMKPEITAPGGNIYSLMNGGGYQNMSGTSMAAPQVTGMAAVLAQYIKANKLDEKTGRSVRFLSQSLLMSTAAPLTTDQYYYSVLQQGAGLANVGNAINAGSYISMDADATDSYADGKVKVELGDDADRTGAYTFGFTIHNLRDTTSDFALSADFFTQALARDSGMNFKVDQTAIVGSTLSWVVDGKRVEAESAEGLENCDFDGNGSITLADGQALLDYVTGVRDAISHADAADLDKDGDVDTFDAYLFYRQMGKCSVEVPANGSVHVSLTVTLDKDTMDYVDEFSSGAGAYVEGYVYADEMSSAEGVTGTSHSIPVLGYYGNWTDASMYDVGSRYDYLSGEEKRAPYLYAYQQTINFQMMTVNYEGDSGEYYFGGNPYVDEDYDPARDAFNPETTTFDSFYYTLIRNAAATRVTVTDDSGKTYLEQSAIGADYSAYYYTNGSTWRNVQNSLSLGFAPTDAPEGSKITVSLTKAPEYYVDYTAKTVDWDALGAGATRSYSAYVDKTAPTISGVTMADGKITVQAADNRYVAAAFLIDNDKQSILARSAGSAKGAELGSEATIELDASELGDAKHILVQVADYADNISTYKINLNPDELSGDVSVKLNASSLTLYKKNTAKLTASVEPFGVQPDTVTWTSSNDAVATVSDNGLVTAIAEGTAVITATSDKDTTKSASCTVTVSNVNTLIYGTLQDADGKAMIYKWDMSKNDTWSNYNDLEAGSAISATMDMDDNLWICDGTSSFKIHKVDVATGKDIASYTNATEVPIWDMEYSYVFSADNDPKVFSIYAYYLLAPNSPTALTNAAFNMQNYMSKYSGASYLAALASAGSSTVNGSTAERVLLLDDAGYIWMYQVYATDKGYGAKLSYFTSNLAELGVKFAIDENECRNSSMILTTEGDDLVLYLSAFTGKTNDIYRMVLGDDGEWIAAKIGSFGENVWPATIILGGQAKETADNNAFAALDTMANVVSGNEVASDRDFSTAKAASTPAAGSLNASTTSSDGEAPAAPEAKTEATLSEDEKTLTLTVADMGEGDTTNGLFTVDYDASKYELTSVVVASEYSSHKDADGTVTVGYVDATGKAAGSDLATLTFTVKDPAAVDGTATFGVKFLERNDTSPNTSADVDVTFHTDTEVRNAKDATCTEDGYTGDTYCKTCGALVAEGSIIPATGHQHTEIRDAKDATCTEDGYTGDTYCTDCNEKIADGTVISATGHQHTEIRDAKDATCTEDGYTGDTYCTDCNEKIADGTVIPATGHDFGEWTVTREATCEAEGEESRTCSKCDAKETRAVPATGHKLTHHDAKAATTEAEGNKEYWSCDICGKLFADAEGKAETTKDALTIAKLPKPTVTPSTGDSNAPALWLSLLVFSAAAAAAMLTLNRKKSSR